MYAVATRRPARLLREQVPCQNPPKAPRPSRVGYAMLPSSSPNASRASRGRLALLWAVEQREQAALTAAAAKIPSLEGVQERQGAECVRPDRRTAKTDRTGVRRRRDTRTATRCFFARLY